MGIEVEGPGGPVSRISTKNSLVADHPEINHE